MTLNVQTNTITLKDGTTIQWPTLRDENGNLASAPATDTLYRNLVTVTDGPVVTFTTPLGHTLQRPQYTLFQVIDSAGNPQTYRIDYQGIDTHSDMCSFMLPSRYPCFEEISVKVVAHQLTLPNNKTYVFSYNNNTPAELSRVDLPTGGFITYVYTASYFPQPLKPKETGISYYGRRGVSTRTVNVGGNAYPWTYATDGENSTLTDPYGNREVREFSQIMAYPTQVTSATPYEISARYYDSNGALLRTVTKEYAAEPDYMYSGAANVRVIRETTTLDNNLVSKRETDYDSFQYTCSDGLCPATATRLNPTEIREFDYGSGGAGPLVRRTDFTYLHTNNSAYTNLNIVDRVLATSIYDGSGVLRAQSQREYDNYTQGLQASGAVQHDSSFGTGYLTRGNVTAVSRWRNTDGAWLTTRNQYDDAGNVLSTTDPGGHPTTYDYSDSWTTAPGGGACAPSGQGKAYPTRLTNSLGHVTSLKYFSCTGLSASFTDPNNQTTAFTYDLMNRPLVTAFPDGGQATLAYDDSALTVTSTTRITSALNLVTTASFDGLGRAHASLLNSDPQGTTYTRTDYDSVGRTWKAWNPTRCNLNVEPPPTSCAGEPTFGLTENKYDGMSRVTKVIPPDGTISSNYIATTYAGNCTTVTDQAGKSRRSCSDGLGRLVQVFEDPAVLNYETDYTYDTLDNLTQVQQKGGDGNSANWRTRTFAYNSLSQLTSAFNPESGTISYTYDPDGNLLTKTAPAPNQTGSATVTTTFTYDAIHRLTQKSFSDSTPLMKYGYDAVAPTGCTPPTLTITNGSGRRTSTCDAAGAEAWSYDVMGRVTAERRTTNGVSKTTSYAYNLDGSSASIAYPSGTTIAYQPGGAGRPLAATDQIHSINYALSPLYAPHGALQTLVHGQAGSFTGINFNQSFNSRLQPTSIRAWSTNGTALDLAYSFFDPVTNSNNGNVASIINNLNSARTQLFTYDALNRLASAKTQATMGSFCWDEVFGYDPWGNLRTIERVTNPTYSCTNEELLSVTPTIKNQLLEYCFDAAGSLILNTTCPQPPFTPTYNYNAENQLTSTAGVTYTYDGDGKRVQKSNGKLYWYGIGSDALVETDPSGNNAVEYIFFGGKRIARRDPAGTISYYFADHLGTSRVVTNATGTVLDDSDFYPFGGERVIVSSSSNVYKFTGKERDSESGLDDFGARYYSSSMARFTAADPHLTDSQRMHDPQQLNMYSYARNNPLRFGDDDGEDVVEKQVIQATYAVHGTTAAEAQANARQSSGFKSETGEAMTGNTSASIRVVYNKVSLETTPGTEASGSTAFAEVKSADVHLQQTITTPVWSERDKASPEEQQAWDQAAAALHKHEEGHVEINRQGAHELDKQLPGTSGYGTGNKPGEAQKEAINQMNKNVKKKINQNHNRTAARNRDYDQKTDHGRTKSP
jgi:RHS repeat-associated protein